jgi:polyhydroxyalkanoate synthesis regulator phasin
MERKHHKEEVMSEKPASGLKKQLESLRDRVQKLSEKINRAPEVDVT